MRLPIAIVLGAAVWPGGAASPTLRRRVERAGALYAEGAVGAIVTTGGLGRHPPSEAAVARGLLLAAGVPEGAVIVEDHSTTTYENLKNAAALLPEGAEVTLVSDFWHLPRARLLARRLGLTATGVAATREGTAPHRTARLMLREAFALGWELLRPSSKR